MVKRFFREILPRRFLPVAMLLLQVALLIHTTLTGSRVSQIADMALGLIGICVCLSVAVGEEKGAFKIGWILLILLLPLFGITLYLMFNKQYATRAFNRSVERSCREVAQAYELPLKEAAPQADSPQARYLQRCGFPLYGRTDTRFLPLGEEAFAQMLEAMEQARHYIFLEFFIIEEGKMWNTILEVLKRKAAQGVTVRMIYDDLGCFFLLPADYPRTLEKWGIQCAPFNPFRPVLTTKQNNRDHRKILSVDGKVAFTGGINLADEYINQVVKFGHWKDTAVRLEGHGAWGLTAMFLQAWRLCSGSQEDPAEFYPWKESPCPISGEGLVQPWCDSPMDKENVGESLYRHIIQSAQRYVYITTPYLIVDETVISVLVLAAKSGVDVRIVTPHHWDKRLVHMTTRSYYRELIRGGVKIYEYTPGFIHSKTFLSDDRVAVVGTANLDFRSLYLHFECGACLYDAPAVTQLKEDMDALFAQCQPITPENCRAKFPTRILQDVMRLFAPLM